MGSPRRARLRLQMDKWATGHCGWCSQVLQGSIHIGIDDLRTGRYFAIAACQAGWCVSTSMLPSAKRRVITGSISEAYSGGRLAIYSASFEAGTLFLVNTIMAMAAPPLSLCVVEISNKPPAHRLRNSSRLCSANSLHCPTAQHVHSRRFRAT